MMTDREMLEDCLEAFNAITVSKDARKLLRKWGQNPGAYAGDGRHILAAYIAKKISEHFAEQPKLTLDALARMTQP